MSNPPMNATAFLKQLSEHESQLITGKGDYEKIHDLIMTVQELESKEQVQEYQEHVLPKLVPFLFLLIEHAKKMGETNPDFSDHDADLMLMKMLAWFQCSKGIEAIAELMKSGHKDDDYYWTLVLNYYIETKDLAKIIVDKLNGQLPDKFLGICYLDMLNTVCRKDIPLDPHPFSFPEGVARLEQFLTNDEPSEYSYANSVTTALPFLPENVWKKLLPLALAHPDKRVQIEALWAGTKLKNKDSQARLIEEAKDYRYGALCTEYLRELGLEDLIPEECQTDEFTVLAEMSLWIAHPNEFGAVPTELSIVDSRTLYWPPTKNEQRLTIVRYRYEKWNEDGTDEIGVGLVGSVTFCLFGLEGLNERTPEEIYAIHCGWEMEHKNYENPEVGMRVLREHNPGFGKSQ